MRYKALKFVFVLAVLAAVPCRAASDDVAELLKALEGKDAQAVIDAEDGLGDLGGGAAEAVSALAAKLGDKNADVRWHACRSLGAIGAKSESAVPALTKALSDSDARVRMHAAHALGCVGKAAMPALEPLIATAFDKEPQVRRLALQALRAIEPPADVALPVWLKTLESSEPEVAATAVQAIAEQGAKAVPKIRELLKVKAAAYWACLIIAEMGPEAAEAVPELTEAVKHESPEVRLEALLALGEIGKKSEPATAAILQVLAEDKFPHVRVAAAYAIASIQPANAEAKKALEAAQQDKDFLLQLMSSWALTKLDAGNKEYATKAVDLAIAALGSSDESIRSAGARVLTEMPPTDRPIVGEHLMKALQQDGGAALMDNLVEATAALGPGVVEKILPSLERPEIRKFALRVFANLGPGAAAAVPALIKAIESPAETPADLEFKREAQFVLGQIGPSAKAAVPALVRALASDHEEIRGSAAFSLGKIGPESREALPVLREMMQKDSSDRLRRLAVWTVLRINPDNPRVQKIALPILIGALESDREFVRLEAATTLGELGVVAKSAVPALEKLKNDSSPAVKAVAEESLKQIAAASAKEQK
jgi:HEAT repeat protein